MARPLCFMVMPFGVKPVAPAVEGAPPKIDCDALWSEAFKPAIEALGYEAHRADQDQGALIIHEMLERLFFSDLVIADMTLPNGNVYYEIGVRHAAKPNGCVLVAADWCKPLFDTQQMRRLTYPLKVERIDAAAAQAIKDALTAGVPALAQGESPMNTVLPGYPSPDPRRATTMREAVAAAREVEAQIDAARMQPPGKLRAARARDLAAAFPAATMTSAGTANAIAATLRDADLWDDLLAYAQALPAQLRERPWVQQQLALARSKSKASDHALAIACLQQLIKTDGDSAENRGLIGGRYKRLADAAKQAGDNAAQRRYLNLAIQAYEAGMRLDLAGYYPVSNLARLYRARNGPGDQERAASALWLTQTACEALRARNAGDDWLPPTLLGAAFDRRDYPAAEQLTGEVEIQGAAVWQLRSTLDDLRASVALIENAEEKAQFAALIERLRALVPSATPAL